MKPTVGDVVLHLHEHDTSICRPADASEPGQQVVLSLAGLSIYQHHRFGAVVPRIDSFADQLRMAREPCVSALFGKARRFIAEDHDNLVLDVDSGVIVISKFVCRGAETSEHKRSAHRTGRRKTEGDEILVQL